MATRDLTPIPSQIILREHILTNIEYWRDYVAIKKTDVTALERGRDRIIKAIIFALDLEEAWPFIPKLIESFSSYMERRGRWEIWHTVLSRAIESASQSNDLANTVTLTVLLARLLQRQGRSKEAMISYRRTIGLARRIEDHFNEARACTNLGYFYIEHGYWYRAEVLCCYALKIFKQIGNRHGQAHTANHLGILYTWQGLWSKARHQLKQACAIWQSMEDPHGLMYGFMNLGMLYVKMDQPDEALNYSTKALDQARVTGEELEIGKIYMNMGLAHSLKGEFIKAETYTRQAERVFRQFSNVLGSMDILENLGVIYLGQQRWPEAILHFERALKGWRTLNNKHDEIQTIIHLTSCELARGNQQQAGIWFKEAEQQLEQHPQARRYYQLPEQINKIRHNLTEGIT